MSKYDTVSGKMGSGGSTWLFRLSSLSVRFLLEQLTDFYDGDIVVDYRQDK